MPIKIFRTGEAEDEKVAWLCDEEWELPKQIIALEDWLKSKGACVDKGNLVADIGFSPRSGAAGGGVAISLHAMKIMVCLGLELWLSEYPEFVDEGDSEL